MPIRPPRPLVRTAALAAILAATLAGALFAVPAAATDRVVVVRPGDTLSEIALQHGVTVFRLLALNSIADPNRIYPGQRLRVTGQPLVAGQPAVPPAAPPPPVPIVHVVHSGEHLTGIARRYGSTVAAIASANRIKNPSYLRVGWRLTIPGTAAPTQPVTAAVAARPAAVPAAPLVHVVTRGQNLTGIAKRYGSTVAAIASANRIKNPSYLRVGWRLTIPAVGRTAAAKPMPSQLAAAVAARGDIRAIIEAEATAQGVPVAFALAVAWQESGWRSGVVSSAGAVGVMQLTPATADWVGSTMLGSHVNLRDARSNVHAGVRLLKHYLARYRGDRSMTLAAYYQGQTGADRHGVYAVTRPYIASILALESFFGG